MLKEWFWEGYIQEHICNYLIQNGWSLNKVADTIKREPGVDILASKDNEEIAIEVKGFPSVVYQVGPYKGQKKKTNPSSQAHRWFKDCFVSAVIRQTEYPNAHVAMAFPDKQTYRELLSKTETAIQKLGLRVFLVSETGEVISGNNISNLDLFLGNADIALF